MGALSLSAPSVLYGFNSDFALPDNLPIQPLAVTVQNNESYFQMRLVRSRAVAQGASFVVDICDTSTTQSYRLTSVAAILASRTPYTGTLNTLNDCAFFYSRTQSLGGECASGFSPDVEEPFKFSTTSAVGAVVTLPISPAVTVAPGNAVTIAFETQYTGSNVTLSYDLGVGVDSAAATFPSALRTQPVTLANVTRSWSGKYCDTPQMQAAIPASSPAGVYYACPKV